MNDKTLLRTGIVGSVIVALCCVTPVLVIALGALVNSRRGSSWDW